MTKTWEEIRQDFEQGVGFQLDHLTKFKWEQFSARRDYVFYGTKEEARELEQVLICENTTYYKLHNETTSHVWKSYYSECIIINNYLLGGIMRLKNDRT